MFMKVLGILELKDQFGIYAIDAGYGTKGTNSVTIWILQQSL
jgi:hypothetical protein